MKSVLINLSQRIDDPITQDLLLAVDHVMSSAKYGNEEKICFN